MPKFYRIAAGASYTVTEYDYTVTNPDEWPERFETRQEAKEAIKQKNRKAKDEEVMADLDD